MKKSMVFEGVAVTLLILLSFLMLAMLLGGGAGKEVSGIGEIQYTYVGSDDTLYVFSGDNISAIGGNGTLLWTFKVPGQWSVCNYGFYSNRLMSNGQPNIYMSTPIVSASEGILYVYMKPTQDGSSIYFMDGALMAISGGKELWELSITSHKASALAPGSSDQYVQYGDARAYASGDRVYVFHDYNETVISKNGTILWNIGNVSVPTAVDEQGFVYFVRSPGPQDGSLKYPYNVYIPDYREPSGTIYAYYPNGTPYWESHAENPLLLNQYVSDTLPIYYKGMVYAPMYNGIMALYQNGTVKWTKTYKGDDFKFNWPFDLNNLTESQKSDLKAFNRYVTAQDLEPGILLNDILLNDIKVKLRLYSAMPFDLQGNVYLQYTSSIWIPSNTSYPLLSLITIGPDGKEISRTYMYEYTYRAAKDGVGYATEDMIRWSESRQYLIPNAGYVPLNVIDLAPDKLIAYDIESGKELWNYTFIVKDPTVVTLDNSNVRTLLDRYTAEDAINNSGVNVTERWHSSLGPIVSRESLQISPGDNVTYASFQSLNYEDPIVLGQSKCAYLGGIYAFDKNGTLLWHKSMPPLVTNTMYVTQNGTVFYQTPDGKVGVTNAGIAAGFTLTALLYLFLRFLCVGAVARAKARLNKNDNRNCVLGFIVNNPGSSLYEIARNTGINLGTVRYHLFILGLNHKVVASQTDGKYVRYFTNSNSYSKEEQLILSLMRRDAMGKVLGIMLKKPGISNVEIARELDIKESVVCRCVKELSEKGVIAKEPTGRGCSVEESQREHVVAAMRRIYGE